MALLELSNVEKIYRSDGVEVPALRGISFSIEGGEFLAIMGPSGSGKSTLLHLLGFLDKPSGGEYVFEGRSYKVYSENERAYIRNKKMGFVFQAFNLLARTSVLDNVKLPLSYSDVPESEWNKKALAAIEQVGLAHRAGHLPSQLSGGEKQRVAIARALINDPEVIFADEPTGNLDSKSGRKIMDLLRKLNRERKHTIILVTHEKIGSEYAERVIKLHDGRLKEDKLLKPSS